MILAAGRGERLRPLTDQLPKPLLAIGGEPLALHQLRWLRRAGVREVVMNVHHLAERIEGRLGAGGTLGMRIRYSREEELLDTGGGILRALPLLRPGPFLVLNGDIWTDYPFAYLLRRRPARGHLVLTPKPDHLRQGDFHLEGRRVRRGPPTVNDLTYCGIAVLDETLLTAAPTGPFSLRQAYFAAAAADELTGERFAGAWVDVGTPDQLQRARQLASVA